MILVTGATGYTGRFLMQHLLRTGQSLRCLVRSASELAELERSGVEIWKDLLELYWLLERDSG